jgi:hypothetical protein
MTLIYLKSNDTGHDAVNLKMLKLCSPHIDKYILHLINFCIQNSSFPDMWKIAIGCPIPKCPKPQKYSDIRMISILLTLSKIFEKILLRQISGYVDEHHLIPGTQNGFRPGFNTGFALAATLDDIIFSLDKNMISILVLLTFDTISHDLSYAKLKYYGFAPTAVQMMVSYLSDRYLKVRFDCEESSPALISSGVPQGSILGPLLFILYTADILTQVNSCKIQAFADDTQLYKSFHRSQFDLNIQVINEELNRIFNLSAQHNLTLNPAKCKILLFCKNKDYNFLKTLVKINIGNIEVPIVESAKNLGLVFDRTLRFKEHVNNLIKKAFSSLKLLYAARDILCQKLKKQLCESLVLSHFNYCDYVYGPCLDISDKLRVQRIQNACCRYVCGVRKFEHITPHLRGLQWLNMYERRKLHLCIIAHKILSTPANQLPVSCNFIRRFEVHNVNIRRKSALTIPINSTTMFERSFSYNAILLYNDVPRDLRSLDQKKFKIKYI